MHHILLQTAKAIGNCIKDGLSVVADFNLITNEIMLFVKESVTFQEKGKLRDLFIISSIDKGRDLF